MATCLTTTENTTAYVITPLSPAGTCRPFNGTAVSSAGVAQGIRITGRLASLLSGLEPCNSEQNLVEDVESGAKGSNNMPIIVSQL